MAPPESAAETSGNQYFRTDHLTTNLGGRTARGGAVAITAQGLKFVITLVATSVMARLLTPQDYGLIGMVAVVTGFVSTYKDLGLSAATIQKAEINKEQISTLFWVNVLLSLGVMSFTIAIAPLIAWFYHEPRLVWITVFTAFGFLISGLAVQHEALLRRQMRYFSLATAGLLSLIVGYGVGILLASKGFSYFALVASQLALGLTNTLIIFATCRWLPGLPRRDTGVRSMIKFGGNLTGFATINYFSRNGDNLLIGRFWGAQELGIYSRAYQLMTLPIDQINEPIASVAIPALSRLKDAPEDYRRAYIRMIEKIAFLTMPAVATMIATADWLVRIVLGPRWGAVAPILQIFGFAALLQPIANATGWLFITQGRTKEMFKMAAWGGPIAVLVIIFGLPWGALGVTISYTVSHVIATPVLYWYVCRRGPIKARDFYTTVGPFLAAAIVGLIGSQIFRYLQPGVNHLLGILICLVIILAAFLLVLFVLPSGRRALIDLIRSLNLLRENV
ncbi:MAG TPA: lipopolysaccharide biosynthesis protein [Pyrinomonadaceae bacterium]|jgi:Membrane protein involved in the export of O-antigen and teichoic acid|nr:lipopolysaccharide biosynthesis protein [Pyrinomonadaceae bacterium]